MDVLTTFIRGHLNVDEKGYLQRTPITPEYDDCPKDENIEKWADLLISSAGTYRILGTEDTGLLMGDGSFAPNAFKEGGLIRVRPEPRGYYDSSSAIGRPDHTYNTFSSALAHELIGRAYAHCAEEKGAASIRNKLSEKVRKRLNDLAVKRANEAYERLGMKRRYRY